MARSFEMNCTAWSVRLQLVARQYLRRLLTPFSHCLLEKIIIRTANLDFDEYCEAQIDLTTKFSTNRIRCYQVSATDVSQEIFEDRPF